MVQGSLNPNITFLVLKINISINISIKTMLWIELYPPHLSFIRKFLHSAYDIETVQHVAKDMNFEYTVDLPSAIIAVISIKMATGCSWAAIFSFS